MASFVLVHGSWHGAWCWERIVPGLRDLGHEVAAIDLPAHGADRTWSHSVTLRSYSERVQSAAKTMQQQQQQRPVLVGHSMGGLAITQSAIEVPEAFASLVYLCAFVPVPGESVYQLARQDAKSLVGKCTKYRFSGVETRAKYVRETFYGGCSEADVEWARRQLCPDPFRPVLQRLRGEASPNLSCGYVECLQDRAVSLERQRAMASRISVQKVTTLDTDHSPFLSAPDQLVEALHGMAALGSP